MLYIILYGSILTKTFVGYVLDYSISKEKINLEDFVGWAISDFAFKMVPIYRVDILEAENDNIIFSNIKCFVKKEDSFTYLAPCRKPLYITKDPPSIEFYLPSTNCVSWKWRTKKEKAPQFRKPTQEIIEIPELTKNKKLYFYSTKERFKIEEELRELKEKTIFLNNTKKILSLVIENNSLPNEEEFKLIKKELEKIKIATKLKQDVLEIIKNSLKNNHTFYLQDIPPKTYIIVGWKEIKNKNNETKIIIVLEDLEEEAENKYFNIWPNTRILKYLKIFKDFFSFNSYFCKNVFSILENKKEEYFFFLPEIKVNFFKFEVFPPKVFFNADGKKICYNPIIFRQEHSFKNLKVELEKIEKEQEEANNKYNKILLQYVPLTEGDTKFWCREINEGTYIVERVTDTFYGKKPLIYLHIIPLQNKTNEKEKIVKGHFIEEEWRKFINKLNGEKPTHPIICRLGICKTEPKSKRKFRTCCLEYQNK